VTFSAAAFTRRQDAKVGGIGEDSVEIAAGEAPLEGLGATWFPRRQNYEKQDQAFEKST